MSCKKLNDHQKFLKEWKETHIGLASSAEMRKNWLKLANKAWTDHKKQKEAEKEKKNKDHESACKVKLAASTAKAAGTPLRVSTANSASSLGLTPVALPEKTLRTLAQCRLDIDAQKAIQAKRDATLCGRVLGSAPVAVPAAVVKRVNPSLVPAARKQATGPRAQPLMQAAGDGEEEMPQLGGLFDFRMHNRVPRMRFF